MVTPVSVVLPSTISSCTMGKASGVSIYLSRRIICSVPSGIQVLSSLITCFSEKWYSQTWSESDKSNPIVLFHFILLSGSYNRKGNTLLSIDHILILIYENFTFGMEKRDICRAPKSCSCFLCCRLPTWQSGMMQVFPIFNKQTRAFHFSQVYTWSTAALLTVVY